MAASGQGKREGAASSPPGHHLQAGGGYGAVLPTQIAPPHPTNPSESTMDGDNSRAVPTTQIMTQYPQHGGMRSSKEPPLVKFYKGEPHALGITQLLIGILGIAFGDVLDLANYHNSIYILLKTHYWTAILYIISGSLSMAAARNPKLSIVNTMIVMNVLSTIAACVGIIILSLSLEFTFLWSRPMFCNDLDAEHFQQCYESEVIPKYTEIGMVAVFLVFNILEFCISISCATFACKAQGQKTFIETVVVVYQSAAPPGNAVVPPVVCKYAEIP